MRLARALARDDIDTTAHAVARNTMVDHLKKSLDRLRNTADFKGLTKSKGKITIGQTVYDTEKGTYESVGSRDVDTSPENIDDLYSEAGRRVGEGLHKALWEALTAGVDDLTAIRIAKIHTAVLLADANVINALEKLAGELIDTLYQDHIDAIDEVGEDRAVVYAEVRGGALAPSLGHVNARDRIVWSKVDGERLYPKHLYVDSKGGFRTKLNTWEHDVITGELARDDVVGVSQRRPQGLGSPDSLPRREGSQPSVVPGLPGVPRGRRKSGGGHR